MADARGSSAGAGAAGAGHGNLGAVPHGQYQAFLASMHHRPAAPAAANVHHHLHHHQYPGGMIPAVGMPVSMPVVPVPRAPYSPQMAAVQPPPPVTTPPPPPHRAQSQPPPGSYQEYSPYGNSITSQQYQRGFADWRMYNNAIMSFAQAGNNNGFHQNLPQYCSNNTWSNFGYIPRNNFGTSYGPATTDYGSSYCPGTTDYGTSYVPAAKDYVSTYDPATKDMLQAPNLHINNHEKSPPGLSNKLCGVFTGGGCFSVTFSADVSKINQLFFGRDHPGYQQFGDTPRAFGSSEIESDSEEVDPTQVEETENLDQGTANNITTNLLHQIDCRDYRMVLRKDLTNSDVGNIGRIVLPKRDAEANLPPLLERDGMILEMDDLVLPATWKFKYRFWPNNKSRMYILETTGEFVKRHNLRSGDILMVYKSNKTSKYVARGVKNTEPRAPIEVLECECLKEGNSSEECGFFVSPTKRA
ncbi:hypothetical protein ACP4OV_026035 [Aristida adscensionis]